MLSDKNIIIFILKTNQKNKCVCAQEMTCIIIMKRMKNGPRRYHINKPRSRHRQIYSEFKKCLSMVILMKKFINTQAELEKNPSW